MPIKCFSLLALLGSAWCAACQPATTTTPPMPAARTERFRLSAGPGCADGYPARIHEARFLTPDGGGFPVPYGHFLTGNWGRSGIGWAVGDEMQAAPDSLEIRLFSYTENKFYEGHFLLPQEKLYALLKQGYWQADEKKQGTYDDLNVTVVPTGVVMVWLRGRLNQVFIGRYQARQIEYDYERFAPGADRASVVRNEQAKLSPAVRRKIAAGTVSSQRWDAYLKTYPWRLEFSRPLTLGPFGVGYRNAEAAEDPPTPDQAAFAQLVFQRIAADVADRLHIVEYGRGGRELGRSATHRVDVGIIPEAHVGRQARWQADGRVGFRIFRPGRGRWVDRCHCVSLVQ